MPKNISPIITALGHPLSILCCVMLGGCIPLTQTEIIPHQKKLLGHVGCDGSLNAGWKDKDTRDESQKPEVDATRSYAISPCGKRYDLQFEPSGRDLGTSYWRTASIWLIDPAKPDRRRKWRNGLWTVHLEFQPPHRSLVFHARLKIWTFLYNPVLHGAPN